MVWFQPRPSAPPPLGPIVGPRPLPKAGTLAATIGIVGAALLLTLTPEEESGRKVDVSIAADGAATIRHISSKQYLDVYIDIAGVPTACDGITRGVKRGQRYNEAQCTDLLQRELLSHALQVKACAPSLWEPGREYARVAAVLFAYNVGGAGFCGSTAKKRFEAGQITGGCNALLAWDKARVKGVLRPVVGLTKRRNRERQICLTGLPDFPAETLARRLKPFM
jgi:lysozyme